ncbi:MAG: hypothetical protein KG075_23305 [Alphaproteobacteria bacterium]|nr:hypothetical protein [Alphaproteobacteria bacterium]
MKPIAAALAKRFETHAPSDALKVRVYARPGKALLALSVASAVALFAASMLAILWIIPTGTLQTLPETNMGAAIGILFAGFIAMIAAFAGFAGAIKQQENSEAMFKAESELLMELEQVERRRSERHAKEAVAG